MARRYFSKGTKRSKGSTYLLLSALFCSGFVYFTNAIKVYTIKSDSDAASERTILVNEFDKVTVPVPIQKVSAGTSVSDIKFKYVEFPKHQLPHGAVTKLDEIHSAVVTAALPADLPLFRSNLSFTYSPTNPVVERIPEGMRAVTVKVDATTAVEGWASSGSLVDVLLITDKGTSVVAEKVKILSAERSLDPIENNDTPEVPSTVTLLVTQEQSLSVMAATSQGKLAFALRNDSDEGTFTRTRFPADELNVRKETHQRKINGYIQYAQGKEKKEYALKDGVWIRTAGKPEGYLLNKE
jgi:Flp pilus assembly protein CpaB